MSEERPIESTPLHPPIASEWAARFSVPPVLRFGAAWGWRLIVVLVAVGLIGWMATRLRVVLIPVFAALIIAALLRPLVDLLAKAMPRLLATWLVLLGFAGSFVGLAVLLAAPFRSATDNLRGNLSTARTDIEAWLIDGPFSLSEDRVDTIFGRLEQAWEQAGSGLLSSPGTAARMAVEVVGGFFLAVVLVFFLLKDGPRMWEWALGHINERRRDMAHRSGKAAFAALQGWIRGVAITGVIDAALIGLALVILGVPGALPIAVLTFFAAFLPIIGATAAGILATAIAFSSNGPTTAIIVALVVLAVQQIEGDVILPLVMHRQVSLHPVVVLVALAVGGAIGGVVGAIISVPITAAINGAAHAARTPPAGESAGATGH